MIELANMLVHLDPTIAFILIGNGAEKKALIQKARDSGVLNKNVFIWF